MNSVKKLFSTYWKFIRSVSINYGDLNICCIRPEFFNILNISYLQSTLVVITGCFTFISFLKVQDIMQLFFLHFAFLYLSFNYITSLLRFKRWFLPKPSIIIVNVSINYLIYVTNQLRNSWKPDSVHKFRECQNSFSL